ncbi:probable WRKY transcription factor 40 isoform X2 [Morus notabilis]|uniref:probable WRKY transcription factor 40 isoform X2 n=1 Tax=Morus notabilis TaxID=981085 RepID=UPI000CED5BED|nr:probable WRKY transcription factor 40 isoform X2 [Morus notabilis]
MDSKWVKTSLDLNLNIPFDHDTGEVPLSELQKKLEFKGDSDNFEEKLPVKEEPAGLRQAEELNRISSENRKLTEMLTVMCGNYNALKSQLRKLMMKENSENELPVLSPMSSRKRKAGSEDLIKHASIECSSSDEESCKLLPKEIKSNFSTVYVRIDSSDKTLNVKDGYQWRKYGQKVTRDNPSPRAYFKCSFAPCCPVKKKVQRSAEDPTLLVVTYEGEHSHKNPSTPAQYLSLNPIQPVDSLLPVRSSDSMATLDLVRPAGSPNNFKTMPVQGGELPVLQQLLVQQMASSLTRDPNFAAALATAISGRIFDGHTNLENSQ